MNRHPVVSVPDYLQLKVKSKLQQLIETAEHAFKKKYIMPAVTYNITGRVAGRARGHEQIMINSVLFMENVDDFINNTVRHEFAHCVDFVNNGYTYRRSKTGNRWDFHGDSWQNVMHVLGDKAPNRCHHYDTNNAVATASKRRFVYVCTSCLTNIPVSKIIHERIQYEGQHRRHRGCTSPIIYSHELTTSNIS
jgi:SprT protein